MTINTIPQPGASFNADLQTFLQEEDADRFTDMFSGFIVSGGTHSTGASLTQTPASLTAYPGGHYITETGSITYPDDTTHIWVICHKDTTTAVTNWTRESGTHYLFRNTGSGTPPTLPADSAFLMKVTTASGSVTAVQDARILSLRGVHIKTANPAITDDVNLKYEVGDFWINTTTPEAFVLVDNSAGAADWDPVFVSSVNVDAAGAVMESDYNANTILAATTDDTPVPVTIADDTLVGRDSTTGDSTIQGLTAAEVRTLLNVENGATADQTNAEIKTAYEANADTNAFTDADHTKLDGIESEATDDTWTHTGAVDLTTGSPTIVSLLSSLPSGVDEINIHITGVSTNTASQAPLIQIGDSGGLKTSGYVGKVNALVGGSGGFGSTAFSSGFFAARDNDVAASNTVDAVIRLKHTGSNVWSFVSWGDENSADPIYISRGLVTLSNVLDCLSITTSGGTATFDGGSAYASYR